MKVLKQDDSGHWYLIPFNLEPDFDDCINKNDDERFEALFELDRLNKHISCLLIKDYEIR